MASSVATPLERQFGRIAGVTEMTSTSSLGSTVDRAAVRPLARTSNAAARDVQAAINAARGQLPANLPYNPNYRKVNPADAPIMILGLVSDTLDKGKIYDVASSILQQKIAQIEGVGQVYVGGGALPAVRVEVNPTALNNAGLSLEDVRVFLSSQNANRPKGQIGAAERAWAIGATDQLLNAVAVPAAGRCPTARAAPCGSPTSPTSRTRVEDVRTSGLANGKPAILIIIFRQPGANIIDTVDRIKALLPQLQAELPPSIRFYGVLDRSTTIRASVHDVQITLADLDRARDPGRVRVPAQRAGDADPQRRGSRLADRDLRRHVPARLQHRQPLADGDDDRDGVRRRRRDRRHREHHPAPREGSLPAARPPRSEPRRSASPSSRSASRSSRCSSRSS